jgi:signal transduction histidine kinase/DNA-binding response OmpR family regulator
LQGLPKRKFLSPHKAPDEEFTLIVPIEIDDKAMEYLNENPLLRPGLYFIALFGNWEFYFNGTLIDSQMFLDHTGQIGKGKNRYWYHNSFPFDRSLIIPGTNILTMRIIGDPTVVFTGNLFFPSYFDDYSLIQKRQGNSLWTIICSILGFAGIYCLFIFFSVRIFTSRSAQERYYLYFGINSLFMCIFNIFTYGLIRTENFDITSNVSIMLLITMTANVFYGMFVENLGRGRTTLVTKIYLCMTIVFCLIMLPASSIQFTEELQRLYIPVYYAYLLYMIFYNIIYFSFWDKKGPRKTDIAIDASVYNIFIVTTFIYFPELIRGVFRIFHINLNFGQYNNIILIIGIFIILAQRYSRMYKRLEDSHIVLEKTVEERTGELKARSLELEQANRAKSDFLAAMSHEIRTPLNAVIGLSESEKRRIKKEKSDDNDCLESFTQIHQSGTYLLGIINDILDISKIESGNIELNPAEYDTAVLVSEVVNLNKVRLGNKPVNFVLDINGSFPKKLTGDELRIKQILNNLLSNAIKFTESGEIRLEVSCIDEEEFSQSHRVAENTEKEKGKAPEHQHPYSSSVTSVPPRLRENQISFSVSDTGIGIRTEDVEKLFKDYTQLDSGANRRAEGTGLGLAISKRLTEMMGGSITVESEYGKGSAFTVEIIQENVDSETIGEETAANLRSLQYSPTPEAHEHSSLFTAHNSFKILAVDDVPANLMVIRKMLTHYNLTVDFASSGQEAIEKIQNGYDLIFMDHMMPGMDGLETLKLIRESGIQTPVIAVTADAMHGRKEYYLEYGFNDYLPKPINTKNLDEVLRKWLTNEQLVLDEKSKENISQSSLLIRQEIDIMRLDKLNHFRAAFDSGDSFEPEYFKRFIAFMESIEIAETNVLLSEEATLLIEAGQQEDLQKIKELLPAFSESFAQDITPHSNKQTAGSKVIKEILARLKNEIQNNDSEDAETILAELSFLQLDPPCRELYFMLYDLLVKTQIKEAIIVIHCWEQFYESKNKD